MVTGLGKQKVILGFPWFEEMNPEINWKKGTLTWRKENRTPVTITEVLDEEEYLNQTQNSYSENNEESLDLSVIDVNGKFTPVWINTKTNLAMDMAIKNNLKKKELLVLQFFPYTCWTHLFFLDDNSTLAATCADGSVFISALLLTWLLLWSFQEHEVAYYFSFIFHFCFISIGHVSTLIFSYMH